MRRAADAVRSLKRYTAEVLGDSWEVRLTADAQATFARPMAAVGPSSEELITGPAHVADVSLPCTIHCYPAKGDDPESALLDALDLGNTLFEGFRRGVGYGGPMRVPLWDYEGVGLYEPASERVNTDTGTQDKSKHGDYMRVADLSINRVRDPSDPTLYTVVADVRLGWRRWGRLPSEVEMVDSVTIELE